MSKSDNYNPQETSCEAKSKIPGIPNRYKDILDDLIDSSDTKSWDWPGFIDKESSNVLRFKVSLRDLWEGEDLSDQSSSPMLKTGKSQLYQRCGVAFLGLKNRIAQY